MMGGNPREMNIKSRHEKGSKVLFPPDHRSQSQAGLAEKKGRSLTEHERRFPRFFRKKKPRRNRKGNDDEDEPWQGNGLARRCQKPQKKGIHL